MRNIYLLLGTVLILLGVFHNRVHLVAGVLTLAAATLGIGRMRTWGKFAGFVYLGLAVLGFISDDVLGLLPVTMIDNVAHLALALVFLYVGLLAPPR